MFLTGEEDEEKKSKLFEELPFNKNLPKRYSKSQELIEFRNQFNSDIFVNNLRFNKITNQMIKADKEDKNPK